MVPSAGLAAVGLGGILSFVCGAIVLGVSVGVQAIASRRKGEKDFKHMAVALNCGLIIVILFSPILSSFLYVLTPYFFPLMSKDPDVVALGIPYLQWRIIGIIFLGINFAFRGYWNGIDLSKFYMSALILINISNIMLNYLLIFGKWGFPCYNASSLK